MIEVKNISKRYGKKIAVDGISFSFEKDKIYGLLGTNGAGKSSIMNILSGYLIPDDGCVIINDVNIHKNAKKSKTLVGFLPETPPLYNNMTVKEYLDFVAEIKGVSKKDREAEVDRVMKSVSINDTEDKLIRSLSNGNKQLVGIAQAIIGNPEVLIFDELTSELDPKQIAKVRSIIKELGKNHTVILSSGILTEISALCDEILILSNGKIIAHDNPENLKKILGDSDEIIISIVGKVEKANSVLRKIPGVKKVEGIGKDSDGHNKIKVNYVSDRDIREVISSTLSNNKIVVVEMVRNEVQLEDVFLKLTSDQDTEDK